MKVLVVAPHADDEVIGVGGTMYKHRQNGDAVFVLTVTKGDASVYSEEYAEECLLQQKKANEVLDTCHIEHLRLPSPCLNIVPYGELVESIQKSIEAVRPDVVYIPHYGDMHFEHKLVAECCMVALRPKKFVEVEILGYEVPSETGWDVPCQQKEFIPNVYVRLEEEEMKKKIDALNEFKLQMNKYPHPRSIEAIESLAKYRGSTVGTEYAEAFMLIRKQRS